MLARLRSLGACMIGVALSACGAKDATTATTPTPTGPIATSVQVTVPTPTLYVGATIQATAIVIDQDGKVMSGQTVTWSTSDNSKATVTSGGLVTAIGVGVVSLEARAGARQAVTTLTVALVPVASVVVTPATTSVLPWNTTSLSAVTRDSAGNVLTGRSIQWTSSSATVAPVDSKGEVTGNLLGSVVITASSEGRSSTARVEVAIAGAVMVGPNIDMDPTLSASQETSVAINPTDPLNIVVAANWYHFASFDGGRSWKRTDSGGQAEAGRDPNVVFHRNGTLLRQGLGSENSGPGHVVVQRSTDGGRTMPPNLRVYAFLPGQGATNEDQGILTVDTVSTSPFVGSAYVIVSEYQATGFTPAYPNAGFPLIVLTSRDGGTTWRPPVDVSDASINAQEHSASITTGPSGEVFAAWIATAPENQIVFSKSLDGGLTWAATRVVRVAPHLPPFLLTADMGGTVTIDVDRSSGPGRGTIYISSIDKNSFGGSAVEAWMVRSTDGGSTWSSPVRLSDGPSGPLSFKFQPRISVAPNGRVDAAWYEIRGGSGTGTPSYDVYHSYSTNGGLTFSASVRVTSATSLKTVSIFGEYMALTSENTRTMVVWTDLRTGAAKVSFAVIWHAP